MLAEIACFFCRIRYSVTFSFWHDRSYLPRIGKIIMSLFEYKRSDSVLFNVILITGGTILFTPQNAQLLTRCHLIGISKVACWGRKCAYIVFSCLQASTKDKKNAANTCSNDVVVTQNNTHHISNSQKTAKSHDRES